MKILNKAQVEALFQREAVLIGSGDVVPSNRVAELFGEGAVKYVCTLDTGNHWNVYCVGGYGIKYLTLKGFYAAASAYNIQQLREADPA